MKTLEKQYLIEAQTKLEALQARMDWMASECATEEELAPLYDRWTFLTDYCNELRKELAEIQK